MSTSKTQLNVIASASLAATIFAISSTLPITSYAKPPYYPNLTTYGNRWLVTSYWDKYLPHPTQGFQILCFRKISNDDNHVKYEWYAPAYPDWRGQAIQEGDQIEMYGGYGSYRGSSAHWEIVGRDTGSGAWNDWIYPHVSPTYGSPFGFYGAEFQRIGYCSDPWPSSASANGVVGSSPAATSDEELWSVPDSYLETAPEVKDLIEQIRGGSKSNTGGNAQSSPNS